MTAKSTVQSILIMHWEHRSGRDVHVLRSHDSREWGRWYPNVTTRSLRRLIKLPRRHLSVDLHTSHTSIYMRLGGSDDQHAQ